MILALTLSAVTGVAPLVLPSCKPGTQETGSLHANTAFEVQMETPKSKAKQPLVCDGKAVTLYVSEYASAASADSAANLTGPQLWGANAPTAEHDDELMQNGAVLVIVSGPGVKAGAKALSAKGFKAWRVPVADGIDRLATAIDCKATSNDPLRAWCAAASVKGAGFTAPKGKVTYVGLSVPLNAKYEVRDTLLKATNISALAFGDGKVTLSDITPDNEGEKKQLLEVAMQIAVVLKGKSMDIKLGKDLGGFLNSLSDAAAKSGYALKDDPKGAQVKMKMPSRFWRVKANGVDVIVVAEDAGDGTFVSVYPAIPFSTAP